MHLKTAVEIDVYQKLQTWKAVKQDKKVHAISFCFNKTPCCFTMLCHNQR